MAQTYNSTFSDSLRYWLTLKGNTATEGEIIYAGDEIINSKSNIPTIPWFFLLRPSKQIIHFQVDKFF
jgi:hypothetical protein